MELPEVRLDVAPEHGTPAPAPAQAAENTLALTGGALTGAPVSPDATRWSPGAASCLGEAHRHAPPAPRPPTAPQVPAATPPPAAPPAAAVAAATAVGEVPAVELDGRELALTEHAAVTARHWARQWWAGAVKAVTKPGGAYHAQPESFAMHDAYRRSRAWVPEGHDGSLIGPAGGAYHLTAAKFGLATGYAWAWIWARPLRLLIAAAILAGVVLGFRFG